MTAELPLHEIVIDFHDRLKSLTTVTAAWTTSRGTTRRPAGEARNADQRRAARRVATIVHRDNAAFRGRQLAERLKDVIPKHLFKIALQATIGGKVVAREDVGALRKDVTAKCYGGDISRNASCLRSRKRARRR